MINKWGRKQRLDSGGRLCWIRFQGVNGAVALKLRFKLTKRNSFFHVSVLLLIFNRVLLVDFLSIQKIYLLFPLSDLMIKS